jgi:hypothetical protein
MYTCKCTPEEGSSTEIQIPTHWNPMGRRLTPQSLGYRPAVFFRHLRSTALSFPQEKFGAHFKNLISISYLFQKLL